MLSVDFYLLFLEMFITLSVHILKVIMLSVMVPLLYIWFISVL